MDTTFINVALGAIVGILFVLTWNVAKCMKLLTEIRDRLPASEVRSSPEI